MELVLFFGCNWGPGIAIRGDSGCAGGGFCDKCVSHCFGCSKVELEFTYVNFDLVPRILCTESSNSNTVGRCEPCSRSMDAGNERNQLE